MVDHFSGLTYVHIIRSTSHKYTLAGKSSLEIWDATFVVMIKRYHADNEIYAGKLFR